MIIPRFKINNTDLHYIDDNYISNTHWLINKARLNYFTNDFNGLKTISKTHQPGNYGRGFKEKYIGEPKDLTQVIPKDLSGYYPLSPLPYRAELSGFNIKGLVFRCEVVVDIDEELMGDKSFDIAVQPIYAPILKQGVTFAKGPHEPIIVLSDTTLDSTLVALLMPIRIQNDKKR